MHIKVFLNRIRYFRQRFAAILRDRRGETTPETAKELLKYYTAPVSVLIDGVRYIVTSHFKKEGKDAAESIWRLMERDNGDGND